MLLICLGFLIGICVILGIKINRFLDKKITFRDLENKHVVVTGGSSGIGKAAALEAARLGANVTIIGRDTDKLKSAVVEIVAKCRDKNAQHINFAALDITSDYASIEKCFLNIEETTGPIFMLINCAGMCICGQFDKMEVNDIKYMIDLNYFGTAYPTRSVLPRMKERKEGIIVFVSTEAALLGIYGYSAYSGAKWAVRGLAETLFMELIGTGVRLTLAFPPDTDTPGFANEELTKPIETKLISGSGGLHSSEDVGKKIVQDALKGKSYSVFGLSGQLMSLLYCSSVESASQVVIQILSMGFLRAVMVAFILSFYKIVKDSSKKPNKEEIKNK